jgi:hypothetical protein
MEDFEDEGVSEKAGDVDKEGINEGVYFPGVLLENMAIGLAIRLPKSLQPQGKSSLYRACTIDVGIDPALLLYIFQDFPERFRIEFTVDIRIKCHGFLLHKAAFINIHLVRIYMPVFFEQNIPLRRT